MPSTAPTFRFQIQPPPANEDTYVERKGFHSINVLTGIKLFGCVLSQPNIHRNSVINLFIVISYVDLLLLLPNNKYQGK